MAAGDLGTHDKVQLQLASRMDGFISFYTYVPTHFLREVVKVSERGRKFYKFLSQPARGYEIIIKSVAIF